MPVSRPDLLELLRIQDTVANKAKDIAGLITGRHMQLPTTLGDDFISYIERSIDACEQARKAIYELDELVETGFRGKEVKLVKEMIETLDKIETETDQQQVQIRAHVFAMEQDLPPVEVIFLYKIIEWIGDVADQAQRVGSTAVPLTRLFQISCR